MKIFVKTLGGTKLEIEVNPEDKVADLKKTLESVHGAAVYPAAQQMLVHQGIFLEDDTTLEENEIVENSSIAIMLSRVRTIMLITKKAVSKVSSTGESSASAAPSSQEVPQQEDIPVVQAPSGDGQGTDPAAQAQQVEGAPTSGPNANLLDHKSRQITAQRVVSEIVQALSSGGQGTDPAAQGQQPVEGAPTGVPNAIPLDLFPQDLPANRSASVAHNPNPLYFLDTEPVFDVLRFLVRSDPQILTCVLQQLEDHDPQLVRRIIHHQIEFLRFINETNVGDAYILNLSPSGEPQSMFVTPEQQQAIDRLEEIGIERMIVLDAFFQCDMDEESTANCLFDIFGGNGI